MTVPVRALTRADAAAFHAIRLEGLLRHPTAFTADAEVFERQPIAEVAARIAPPDDSFVLGAFPTPETLAGVVGFHREEPAKTRHRGTIWGMYVRESHQGRGHGEALLRTAIARAAGLPGMAVIELGVETGNLPALRLYESVGFVPYGTQRDAIRFDGARHDELLMALNLR